MRFPHQKRPAKILVFFALLLPALLGMLGLVIDGGLLMSAQRQTQNAADSAAVAAARDLIAGNSRGTANADATTYVQTYNKLPNASVVLNIPPTQGTFAGSPQYVEAIVTNPVNTWFIQVIGASKNQQVRARAVAGYEYFTAPMGIATLNPTARPGLSLSGAAGLRVNGRVVVNADGAGLDQNLQWINYGDPPFAVSDLSTGKVQASDVPVVGGVNNPTSFQSLSGGGSPLRAGLLPAFDPFINLPVPSAANGANLTRRGGVSLRGGVTTLRPGVYDFISISRNARVTFQPGIYILKATGANALTITGTSSVTGIGVMFYNTGSDYLVNGAGYYDSLDGENPPPAPDNPTFGSVNITTSGTVNLQGLNNARSPFDGMLFYQRRLNPMGITVRGAGAARTTLTGTIYAKWADMHLSGLGTYNSQFITGSMSITGAANVTIDYVGKHLGKASQVFLVE